MSLSNPEKKQLMQLMQSPQWGAFEHLIKDLKDKYRDDMGARDSEWETVKNNLLNEGRIRGLTELIQETYIHIQNEQG